MSEDPLDALEDEAHRYFADQVRLRAQRKGLALYRLAQEAKMSEVTLHRLLSGERSPKLRQLVGLAAALRCRPKDLLP